MLDIAISLHVNRLHYYWSSNFMVKLGITHNKALKQGRANARRLAWR